MGSYFSAFSYVEWKNKIAIDRLKEFVNKFGDPNIYDLKPNGLAIWTREQLDNFTFYGNKNVYEEIMIKDEAIEHKCPESHIDNIYVSIIVPITANDFNNIQRISGSLSYDPLKKKLTARSDSINSSFAILYSAIRILTKDDSKSLGIQNEYIYNHRSFTNPNTNINALNNSYRLFSEKLKKHNDELTIFTDYSDFWPSAFSSTCGAPNNKESMLNKQHNPILHSCPQIPNQHLIFNITRAENAFLDNNSMWTSHSSHCDSPPKLPTTRLAHNIIDSEIQ